MPPISVTARSVSESDVGNPDDASTPTLPASRPPATPVMNDASANAQSL